MGLLTTAWGQPRNLTFWRNLAEYARRFIQAGAHLVGGCCGTTPDHIRGIASMVKALKPSRPSMEVRATPPRPPPQFHSNSRRLMRDCRRLSIGGDILPVGFGMRNPCVIGDLAWPVGARHSEPGSSAETY